MDENDKYIPEEWNEHQRKVAEIKAAAGTDAEPDLYRDVKQDGYNLAGIFCIVAGLVAMFILGAMAVSTLHRRSSSEDCSSAQCSCSSATSCPIITCAGV